MQRFLENQPRYRHFATDHCLAQLLLKPGPHLENTQLWDLQRLWKDLVRAEISKTLSDRHVHGAQVSKTGKYEDSADQIQ